MRKRIEKRGNVRGERKKKRNSKRSVNIPRKVKQDSMYFSEQG